jgi:hypothetical protein
VLYILHAKAHDNKTKKRAGPVFGKMTEMLKKVGSLGDAWGPLWDDSKADKLSSFALPHDQTINRNACSTSNLSPSSAK